jgi:hypothetical protein
MSNTSQGILLKEYKALAKEKWVKIDVSIPQEGQ